MKIDILSMTPNFLKVIWVAARTCKSHKTPQELWQEEPTREEMLRLARNIIKSGHHSVLEHCTVTFAVSGVSRALLAQYTRHRIGVSISVQSQRAVRMDTEEVFDHLIPPSILENDVAAELYLRTMYLIHDTYSKLKKYGIKNEDARFVLPNATLTNFVTTLNLRSLLDVYQKRVVTPGAQWEIKEMLKQMARLVVEREPWLKEFLNINKIDS